MEEEEAGLLFLCFFSRRFKTVRPRKLLIRGLCIRERGYLRIFASLPVVPGSEAAAPQLNNSSAAEAGSLADFVIRGIRCRVPATDTKGPLSFPALALGG